MKNKKGFTLLELLIAATIVGLLAVFATVSYKESAADNRMAAAKIKAEQLATALQRFRLDYTTEFSGLMGNLVDTDIECQPTAQIPKTLITCGYVDNGGWTDSYVEFYACNGKTGDCASSPIENPLACMKGRNRKQMPDKYKSLYGYIYCVSATEKGETLGVNNGGVVPVVPGEPVPGGSGQSAES